jgi:hypothetical protein
MTDYWSFFFLSTTAFFSSSSSDSPSSRVSVMGVPRTRRHRIRQRRNDQNPFTSCRRKIGAKIWCLFRIRQLGLEGGGGGTYCIQAGMVPVSRPCQIHQTSGQSAGATQDRAARGMRWNSFQTDHRILMLR